MLRASWYTSANARLSSSIPTNMGAQLLPFLTWVLNFCCLYCHTVYLLLCNNYYVTILLIYIDVSIIHYFSEMCGHSDYTRHLPLIETGEGCVRKSALRIFAKRCGAPDHKR